MRWVAQRTRATISSSAPSGTSTMPSDGSPSLLRTPPRKNPSGISTAPQRSWRATAGADALRDVALGEGGEHETEDAEQRAVGVRETPQLAAHLARAGRPGP